ncbi:hypothetical protein PoB_005168400 [Plakobranchus ocellatus]|uniref:Uncharacterized protein n=1 Tax=Plakobranchus ocellatus TaxID=259542 RepID=A0AAV4C231_9GAST|nr:hypothetical protein PoB_005168400 [Plakobranchus ocellatus]
MGNGDYGIYMLWPDDSTSRECRSVREKTCRFDCQLKSVLSSHRKVFTYCRALVQAVNESGRANTERVTVGAPLSQCVQCRELDTGRSAGWLQQPLNEKLWRQNTCGMSAAANMLSAFLRRAIQ